MEFKVTLLSDGYCVQWGRLARRDGKWRRVPFASMFALIEHPQFGPILFDTGYTRRFFEETRAWPERLYALTTPVTLSSAGDVLAQLQKRNISPAQIRHIIISHFHADHIGGLKDFPNARFHCARAGFEATQSLRGLNAVRHAFLPGLMPADFPGRVTFVDSAPVVPLPESFAPFRTAYDVLGDGSLLAVELPGHAPGQIGLFLKTSGHKNCLLVADACWSSHAFRKNVLPHPLVRFLVDWPAYRDTLEKLHQLHRANPELIIIPSHCEEIWTLPL